MRGPYSAKRLYPFFRGWALEALTGADVRKYVVQGCAEGVSNGAINKEVGLLRVAVNWARRELGWDIPNPAEGSKLKEPSRRTRWLSRSGRPSHGGRLSLEDTGAFYKIFQESARLSSWSRPK